MDKKEYDRERAKRKYWRDPEKNRKKRRNRYAESGESEKQRLRRWREEHPEVVKGQRTQAYTRERMFAEEKGIKFKGEAGYRHTPWTSEELHYIEENIDMPPREIAKTIHRSIHAIGNMKTKIVKAKRLNEKATTDE